MYSKSRSRSKLVTVRRLACSMFVLLITKARNADYRRVSIEKQNNMLELFHFKTFKKIPQWCEMVPNIISNLVFKYRIDYLYLKELIKLGPTRSRLVY